jgi:hypothetical protein
MDPKKAPRLIGQASRAMEASESLCSLGLFIFSDSIGSIAVPLSPRRTSSRPRRVRLRQGPSPPRRSHHPHRRRYLLHQPGQASCVHRSRQALQPRQRSSRRDRIGHGTQVLPLTEYFTRWQTGRSLSLCVLDIGSRRSSPSTERTKTRLSLERPKSDSRPRSRAREDSTTRSYLTSTSMRCTLPSTNDSRTEVASVSFLRVSPRLSQPTLLLVR